MEELNSFQLYISGFTPNSNNGVFVNLPAGNYVIGVVDNNNCTKTINEIISSPTPAISSPTFTVTNPSCYGFS